MSVPQLDPPPVVLEAPRAPEMVSPFRLFEVLWRRKGTLFLAATAVLLAAVPRIMALPSRFEGLALGLDGTRTNKLPGLQPAGTAAQSEVTEVRTQGAALR